MTNARDLSELKDALRLADYSVIVTVDGLVGSIEKFSMRPVVTIQDFIPPPPGPEAFPPAARFDRPTFLGWIRFLTESRSRKQVLIKGPLPGNPLYTNDLAR